MTYTREEREIIKNNIKMIENYCKTEIAPLVDGGSVTADFSEIQYRKDGSAFKKSYFFTVRKNGVAEFTSSALTMVIDENYEHTGYSVNAYENLCYMEELLIRWQTVKTKLLNEIYNKRRMKSKILNFSI